MDSGELGLEGIVPDGEEDEPAPELEPEPTEEILLLTEIRDLMKEEAARPKLRARIVSQKSSAEKDAA